MTLDLTITSVASQATQIGDSLLANMVGDSLQWIDCSTGLPIAGATGQVFEPMVSGDYAVVIFENSCQDTSNCLNVTLVGMPSPEVGMSLYPNPNTGAFTLSVGEEMLGAQLSVFNARGDKVYGQEVLSHATEQFDLDLAVGMYLVVVEKGELVRRRVFVVR